MNKDDIPKGVVLVAVVVVVVVATVIGVGVYGFGGSTDAPSSGSSPSDNASSESQKVSSPPETKPFTTEIVSIENCGQTCRDVTAELQNEMGAEATNVSVRTWIYAGNTTENDSLVWEGEKNVGDLEAGGTYRTTSRVELSFFEGVAIQNRGGWITVVTKVNSAQENVRFENRYKAG